MKRVKTSPPKQADWDAKIKAAEREQAIEKLYQALCSDPTIGHLVHREVAVRLYARGVRA